MSAGAYGNDLASYPDEAAHFVSAVCLLDYVALAPGSNPVGFAQAYYAHFPKVAFGHWPPGFFVEQAAWYAIFGASPAAGLLLVGITALIAGIILFRTIDRFFGGWVAVASLAVYLALPTVRLATSMLMPDLTVTLFAFMAVQSLAEGCVRNGWRPWLACAAWSTALVLTKESGLMILFFAPVAFLLFGGQQRWSKKAAYFWGSLAVFCMGTLAVYQGTGVLQMRGLPSTAALPPLRTRIAFLNTFVRSTPWLLLATAAVGATAVGATRDAAIERRIHTRCHALWVALWLLGQVTFRDIIEVRYFLPAVPSLMVLFAAGLDRIDHVAQRAARSMAVTQTSARRAVTSIVIGICCIAMTPSLGATRRRGYAAAVDALGGAPSSEAVLISSDASGAGALIADIVSRRRDEDIFAVRSDKVLASSDWMGYRSRLLTSTTDEVLELLDSIPIRYVVLDAHASILDVDREPHRLLRDAIGSRPDQFRLVANLPLYLNGARYDEALRVFENIGLAEGRDNAVRLPLSALAVGQRRPHLGEWSPRSSSTIAWEVAIEHLIDIAADRATALLPLSAPQRRLPPMRPSSDRLGAAGGSGESLVAPEFGDLTITSSDTWIHVSSGEGSGARVLRYTITPNVSSSKRTGFISVGAIHYPISQDARQ